MLTYFISEDLPQDVGSGFVFEGDDAHHAIKVLRIKVGEEFILTDGKGHWVRARAVEVSKKFIITAIDEVGFDKPLTTQFTVVQALPKSDRVKEALELLTEGGVDRIIPWQASRSIGKGEKSEKWSITLREATKQSRRTYIPEVADLAHSKDIVKEIKKADCAIIFHQDTDKKLSEVLPTSAKKVLIIIGPEGGLTDEEIEEFREAGAQLALMGRPVLRAAHAGLAALSAINALLRVW